MAQSKLEQIAIIQRGTLIPINSYNSAAAANNYTATHTRALGDAQTPEAGRGSGGFLDIENYDVGTATDINGNPNVGGSGREPAFANNGSTWGYTPSVVYSAPDTSLNQGQVIID